MAVCAKFNKSDELERVMGNRWSIKSARPAAIRGQFAYLDEKEFRKVKTADPNDFYDNSLVDALANSGFLKNLGMK